MYTCIIVYSTAVDLGSNALVSEHLHYWIHSCQPTLAHCMFSITELRLSNTGLVALHHDMFTLLKQIKCLVLRENLITKVDKDAFGCLPNLLDLHLKRNKVNLFEMSL